MKKICIALFLLLGFFANAATYYAQATGNINAIEWDPVKGGSVGSDLVWANLAAEDILIANGQTVTINVSFTCGSIQTDADGGGFSVGGSGTITITADVISTATRCLACSSTGTVNLIGDITGGTGADDYGMQITQAGTINHTGDVTAGSGSNAHGMYVTAAATVTTSGGTVTGSATSGYTRGIVSTSTGTFTINSNCIGGAAANAYAVYTTGSTVTSKGNLVNTPSMAIVASTLVWNPSTSTKYMEFSDGAGGTIRVYKWPSGRGLRSRYKYEPN